MLNLAFPRPKSKDLELAQLYCPDPFIFDIFIHSSMTLHRIATTHQGNLGQGPREAWSLLSHGLSSIPWFLLCLLLDSQILQWPGNVLPPSMLLIARGQSEETEPGRLLLNEACRLLIVHQLGSTSQNNTMYNMILEG